MKQVIFFCSLMMLVCGVQAASRTANGLTEAEQLGITGGTALACNAGAQMDDFELIASRIIANKALTKEEEEEGYRQYATSKFNAYNEQKNNPQLGCGTVLESFRNLPIFKSVVYADGSVKMYDGSYLKPKRPVVQQNVQKGKFNQVKKKK